MKFTMAGFLLLSWLAVHVTAGVIAEVRFEQVPSVRQFFTRDENDSSKVPFTGVVPQTGYDAIEIILFKDEILWKTFSQALVYADTAAPFNLEPVIHAELSEYKFEVNLVTGDVKTHIVTIDSIVCGDAYILSGQSNSHYVWEDATFTNEFCRTFGVKTGSSNYFPYQPEDTLWSFAQGTVSTGPNVGVLGLYIQKLLLEKFQIPTCILNGGTGGSVIAEHLPDENDRFDLNTVYGRLLYRYAKSKLKRIRGIIWHQGENDSDGQNTSLYAARFERLKDAWDMDFNPEKIYVFQIRPGCGGNTQSRFREVQRNLAALVQSEDICIMSTAGIPGHDGCHYSLSGYQTMAQWITGLISADFYGSTDTLEVYPPNIIDITYVPQKKELHLLFENTQSLDWPADTLGQRMEDYFYLDGYYGVIDSGYAREDSVILMLNGYQMIDRITYLPNIKDNTGLKTFQGPWLANSRKIGALSFHEFPVVNPAFTIQLNSPNGGEIWNPGTPQTILWQNNGVNEIDIEFSQDNGMTWIPVAEKVSAAAASFPWQAPDIESVACKMRITDSNNQYIADESNLVFSVVSKSLVLQNPNGGEKLMVDSVYTIKWQSAYIENVRIQYSADNGAGWNTVKRITSAAPGEVEWIVPDDVSDSCRVKIIDAADAAIYDVSDQVFTIRSLTGVNDGIERLPEKFELQQNWPNPFNPYTTIEYVVNTSGQVRIDILNSLGEKVITIVDEHKTAGNYRIVWQGTDSGGMPVASGIYYYVLYADHKTIGKKMLLIR